MKTNTLLAAGIGLTALLTNCQAKDDDPQQPPVASFTYSGAAQNFTPIVFSSTAPGAASYAWDFGDATTATQPNPSHTFRRAGTYTVVLRATGAAGTATSSQTLTLSQADTAVIISQRLAGSYRFNRVYRVNYNTYTNSPIVYTRLRDTTLTLTPVSRGGVSFYGRSWTPMGSSTWASAGVASPSYTYVQGIGAAYTGASFLQSGDSVSFSINNFPSNGPGPKEYLSFYGGKIR
ncbi:PKD domain-containing protein [Hymenobacter convexus]|uniref:PKD domain-containing protein n=1 Tax=Hymenobacter sp. CA1UV-4 TaxID=3063782 RepID=UPI0027141F53|nr:PKD domain-containing protein [Hymenobacter sp. CA1UV-4]MDO7850818.1 PKD domain-containing protein [Hymenobacter sp. CA1UV-4]